MEEDWDTLVVLDACRADLFEERADLSAYDSYQRVTSNGSATREWTIQNFVGEAFGDTVYVTANPYVSREASDSFHRLVEPWLDRFDDESRTVHPEDLVEVAAQIHEDHPDKRVVVHFMQPHHPFITRPDLQFKGWAISDFDEWTEHQKQTGMYERGERPHTPWDALYMGLAEKADVWDAYGENLDVTLDALEDLLDAVEGRTVVTSDHGNMLGERTWPIPMRVFGHPSGVRNDELVSVPWAVVETGERRDVTDEGVRSVSESESDVMEERLEDLGYV